MSAVRILLVDDQADVRAAFRALLETEPGFEVAGEAGSGTQAIEAAQALRPDVILLGVPAPGLDGLRTARGILEADGEPPRVLLLTRLGAETVAALRSVTGAGADARSPALAELTARELEVLGLVARGLSNAEIAAKLSVSETTAKTHVARILLKLDLRDRVQAVVFAYESGLVRPGAGA